MDRKVAAVVVGGALLFAAYLLIGSGVYGLSLFVSLPIILGGSAALIMDSRTAGEAMKLGAASTMLATLLFFSLGWEGAICIVMSWPLAIPLGILGGWIALDRKSGV